MHARKLTAAQRNEVSRWWQSLAPSDQQMLQRSSRRAPSHVVARFVEPGSLEESGEDEGIDFYEYLVNHELSLDDGRRFHICSAHPAARAVLACGHLPAGFQCPRANNTCPMRVLLNSANGRDVKLSLIR